MKRREGGGEVLLAYRNEGGWHDVTAARERAVVRAVSEVAGYLGNTPSVARGSYIDPRVIEEFSRGRTVARALSELATRSEFGELATEGPVESAVLRLLARDG